jgi:hypothetical protein
VTVKAKSISCPNCGGPVELRGFAHTLTLVCPQCLSVLDASSPEVEILQKFEGKAHISPTIPLGTRGTFEGVTYEVIGFQVRRVHSGGDTDQWDEYLLFNPFQGFRYLTEFNGHWNFVRVLSALPEETRSKGKRAMRLDGRAYLHFDSMIANTAYVLGEFPWQVRLNDAVACQDFVAPPYMLSSESTGGEITWSRAQYMTGAQLWSALRLPGAPPVPSGVFANQPPPHPGSIGSAWRTWLWLNVALAALVFFFSILSPGRVAFSDSYVLVPGVKSDTAFVTPSFKLTGRDSNVELGIKTNVQNNWAYFNFALINEKTGQAFDFGREVSYYRDSDRSEGSPNNSVVIPAVPSGQYHLRVEPEADNNSPTVRYDLILRRNVPNFALFGIAALLLLIPPVVVTVRRAGFEAARWRESDYAPSQSSSGNDGGDDD